MSTSDDSRTTVSDTVAMMSHTWHGLPSNECGSKMSHGIQSRHIDDTVSCNTSDTLLLLTKNRAESGGRPYGTSTIESEEVQDVVPLKDCFVKVRRLSDRQSSDDEPCRSKTIGGERHRLPCSVMCDGCGDLLASPGALLEHEKLCVGRTSPSKESGSVALPPRRQEGEFEGVLSDHVIGCKNSATSRSAPPSVACHPQDSGGSLDSFPLGGFVSGHSLQVDSVRHGRDKGSGGQDLLRGVAQDATNQVSQDQVGITQDAMFEMLQIADHFLRFNALSQGAPVPSIRVPRWQSRADSAPTPPFSHPPTTSSHPRRPTTSP